MGTTEELPHRVLAEGLVFPECPRWHGDRLFFSDVHGHRVVTLGSDDALSTFSRFADDRPSGLGFSPDGTLLVATHFKRHVVAVENGTQRVVSDLSAMPGDFLNDMVVDRQGRAYVGVRVHVRYGGDAATPSVGVEHIVLVEPDGTARVVVDGIVSPNGMVISEDGGRLIVAETHAHRLAEYDIAADGSLRDRRVLFADLGSEVWPDGIALDSGDGVWIGSPLLGQFLRVVRGGEVTHRVRIAGRWAVACALGGPDRRTLYMMTTRTTLENLNRLTDWSLDPTSESVGFVEATTVPIGGAGIP